MSRPRPQRARLSLRAHGHSHGLWRSLVAHLTGGQGVAGSNPVSPTKCEKVAQRATFSHFPGRETGEHLRAGGPPARGAPGAAPPRLGEHQGQIPSCQAATGAEHRSAPRAEHPDAALCDSPAPAEQPLYPRAHASRRLHRWVQPLLRGSRHVRPLNGRLEVARSPFDADSRHCKARSMAVPDRTVDHLLHGACQRREQSCGAAGARRLPSCPSTLRIRRPVELRQLRRTHRDSTTRNCWPQREAGNRQTGVASDGPGWRGIRRARRTLHGVSGAARSSPWKWCNG